LNGLGVGLLSLFALDVAPASPAPTLAAIVDSRVASFPGSALIVAHIGPSGVDITKSGTT